MNDSAPHHQDTPTLLCIDLGTTNTRIWRTTLDGGVLTQLQAPFGVRDSAREGSSTSLRQTLHNLIRDASQPTSGLSKPPIGVIAAGMITSALGLREIPHLPAPADLAILAEAVESHLFPDVTDLPVLLVPGVRCGPGLSGGPADVATTDLMRGEETLCIGLHQLAMTAGGATVLNLGSHWKAIGIDQAGCIVSSSTSLSGEMIHAVHERTILHSALPAQRPDEWDPRWLKAGMNEARASGLARALFVVRLLELAKNSSPIERQAYFIGAFIAADAMRVADAVNRNHHAQVLLTGNLALSIAWQTALADLNITAIAVSEAKVEQATLAGLRAIYKLAKPRIK